MNIHTVLARTVLTLFPIALVLGAIAYVGYSRGYSVPKGGDIVEVVQERRPNRVRASIPGETRRTPTGEPVAWDLVLRGPDRYAWHRTDWLPGVFTAEVARCGTGSGSR